MRLIRETEGFSQRNFAQALEISSRTIERLELERNYPNGRILEKIAKKFPEYSLWLLTDQTNPAGGQISPEQKIKDKPSKVLA